MSRRFIIAGTDTDAGKTVFAAALTGVLDGCYWKPIQCGLEDGGDVEVVRRLSGLPAPRIIPEFYRFKTSASPHRAAEIDGVIIDVESLVSGNFPVSHTLVIEGAGGLMVPLTRDLLQIDLFARWNAPVILVARTALGTINHSLLSIEAMRHREIPIHGVAFAGEENADSERTICAMGRVRRLGRLPHIANLNAGTLRNAFAANFRVEDFTP